MRISRIYQAASLTTGEELPLDERASHYLSRVLRSNQGDPLLLFDGKGHQHHAVIVSISKRQVAVRVGDASPMETESPLSIHLFQGMSRHEKMDLTLQKAVELGITAFTPVITSRSQFRLSDERLEKRLSHWEGVMISACEQSGRTHLPTLHAPCDFKDIPFQALPGLAVMLDPLATNRLDALTTTFTDIALFIGPEGGFDEAEHKFADQHKIYKLACGPRILRTETAAIAACVLLQNRFGDL